MDAASSVVETAVEAAAGAAETTMGAAADAVADAAEEVLAEFTTVTMTTTMTTLMPSMGSLILMVLFVFAAAYFVTNYFLGGSLIGPKRTIALLVGPAGSGKTTLMKQVRKANNAPPAPPCQCQRGTRAGEDPESGRRFPPSPSRSRPHVLVRMLTPPSLSLAPSLRFGSTVAVRESAPWHRDLRDTE